MPSARFMTRTRYSLIAIHIIAIFLYFILGILHGSFLFLFAIGAMLPMVVYVPLAVWHAYRRSKRTWDRAGAEVAYLSIQAAIWFSISVLGIYFRGPTFCAQWSFELGQQQRGAAKGDGPNFDTNTQVLHSCDVDTVLNAVACAHFALLLIWLLWIIYLVRHLPFERKIAFKCGVARVVRGEYNMELGTGTGGGRPLSRHGTLKRRDAEMEMGAMGTDWSGTEAPSNTTDMATLSPISDNEEPDDGEPTSPRDVQPADETVTRPLPPLPPRPIPADIGTDPSPPEPYHGPPLGPPLPPALQTVQPAINPVAMVETADIPPPAYEPQTMAGPPGSSSRLHASDRAGTAQSSLGTMNFDSFMRAQQHKMEYKLMLERTGQVPLTDSPGDMGEPGGSGSRPMWGGSGSGAADQDEGRGQRTAGTLGETGWGMLSREGDSNGRSGEGSQRRRRGSL